MGKSLVRMDITWQELTEYLRTVGRLGELQEVKSITLMHPKRIVLDIDRVE